MITLYGKILIFNFIHTHIYEIERKDEESPMVNIFFIVNRRTNENVTCIPIHHK